MLDQISLNMGYHVDKLWIICQNPAGRNVPCALQWEASEEKRQMKREDWKLRELLLYISARGTIGATKLNKILFHAEFEAYRTLGRPITGHPYIKRKNGPAPQQLRNIRTSLQLDGSAEVAQVEIGAPHPEDRIVPLRAPRVEWFTSEELAIVDSVIAKFGHMSGTAMAEESHRIPGWRAAHMNEEIPYATALVSGEVTEADRKWASEVAAGLAR